MNDSKKKRYEIDGTIAIPSSVRLEASTLCQLQCPCCPGTHDQGETVLGKGYLPFKAFKAFVDQNPPIRHVELASSGEVFLNPNLPEILEYAFLKNIRTTVNEGANLNHATDEALEALVRFQTEVVRCAIDGTTQETYAEYRIGGKLENVFRNIRKINNYKIKYRSRKPLLIFQFIIFGHNEHEMEKAYLLSKILKMKMAFRHNDAPDFKPVRDRKNVSKWIGYADRRDYLEKTGKDCVRGVCHALWKSPQINWDGKLLGCSNNRWVVYSPNAFEGDLESHFNAETIRYARMMLMGKKPPRKDMPCLKCEMYAALRKYNNWITADEIENWRPPHERLLDDSDDQCANGGVNGRRCRKLSG